MDLESISPMKSPPINLHSSSHSSFPIIAIAIIGIFATIFLLVTYYVFAIKCCLNWQRIDLLRPFSFLRSRNIEDPLTVYSQAVENQGLNESVIRSIPVFQYKKREEKKDDLLLENTTTSCECVVCLNEFQEDEMLRIIPNCAHVFHIDCIDIWLQNNANCPLCRTSISLSKNTTNSPLDQIITPQDQDYVVIEIGNFSFSPSPRKIEPNIPKKKVKNLSHVSSMGDECIDINRKKDEEFTIQPIRRSFSMDSASDRQLYVAVQEIMQQQRQVPNVSPSEGSSSSSSRIKRFFSFGNGRGSRNAVLPVHLES
ncbi:RING-H2 finger protein ATL16-like [Nicotiana tomentosiformis]|uniref:RING-H2 finger protein ATL16-like n=1 Tax=Nicotiana tomentosiformis TaxID=4098 RepID=UPI00051BAA12|nr:RING-H2 finger protein ATL16-like [Nicotiana tomentosiformis]